MTAQQANGELLSSWKEISDYLGCDERTCRRWELSLGLPIHRMEGTAKSRVYAYKGELEGWRKEKLSGAPGEKGGLSPEIQHGTEYKQKNIPGKLKHTGNKFLWLIPIAAVFVAAVIYLDRPSPGEPADFGIKGSRLIVLDKNGKKLWDYDTKLDMLAPEEKYRQQFQVRRLTTESNPVFPLSTINPPLLPFLVYKDIDQDGRLEVLFCPKTTDEYNETGLFCLDHQGTEIWNYKPGRELDFGGLVYSGDYRIAGIEPYDINGDGTLEIFMLTAHQPHSPSGLVLLDCHGKLLGEFLNFGRISDLAYGDFNGDGKTEVAAGCENDEYGKASLAVFDPSRIAGSSPQSKDLTCGRCGDGSEEYYILFPRTDVDLILYPPKENIKAIHVLENNRLELDTHVSHVYFELDFRFRVLEVKGSDLFREAHREMKTAGKIKSELTPAYWEALKNGVLYWNGKEWTSTPSMNLSEGGAKITSSQPGR